MPNSVKEFLAWLHAAICALADEQGRKGWAMAAALGCAIAMTCYSVVALYLIRANQWFVFLLGMSAMVINLIVITGLMVLLGVRRKTDVEADTQGIKIHVGDGFDGVAVSKVGSDTAVPPEAG